MSLKNQISKARERFNETVRSFGNKVCPKNFSLSNKFGFDNKYKGLGDLLTTEIQPRHIGATVGGLLPLMGWGALEYASEGIPTTAMIMAPIDYMLTCYLSVPASIALGVTGYAVGLQMEHEKSKRKQN